MEYSSKTERHASALMELMVRRIEETVSGDIPRLDGSTRTSLMRYALGELGLLDRDAACRLYTAVDRWNIADDMNALFDGLPTVFAGEFSVIIANVLLMRCIHEKIGEYRTVSLPSELYSEDAEKSFDVYEKTFGALTRGEFARLAKHFSNDCKDSEYPVLRRPKKTTYAAALSAAKAYRLQHGISKMIATQGQKDVVYISDGDTFWRELSQAKAPDAIYMLTDGEVDIRDGWTEDKVSYELAAMLLSALRDFYEDAIEQERAAKRKVEMTKDSVSYIVSEYEIPIKLDCFLDGVPTSDILA